MLFLGISFDCLSQRFELRPNVLFSFHNIARVPAAGLRLEGLLSIKSNHFIYSGLEVLYGEGNPGFKNIQKNAFYSYRFDNKNTGHTSAGAYLYSKPLKVKSARLNQAAFKAGYLFRQKLKKNTMEVRGAIYGNYVSGTYVLKILDDVVSYNPNGDNIEYFVVPYFFNYLDIGPSMSLQYVFKTTKSVAPVIGIEYNYGSQHGSWVDLSLGIKLNR